MAINGYLLDELFRTSWEGPQATNEFAQTLYNILSAKDTVITGPLTIKPNPDSPTNLTPPITVYTPTGGTNTTIIQTVHDGTTTPFSGGGGDGTGTVNNIFPPAPPDANRLTPFSLVGTIASGGPGANYVVTVLPYGTGGSSYMVNAVQLQIDSGATIPVGTSVTVLVYPYVSGGITLANYYLNVPVWL